MEERYLDEEGIRHEDEENVKETEDETRGRTETRTADKPPRKRPGMVVSSILLHNHIRQGSPQGI